MKRFVAFFLIFILCTGIFSGCGTEEEPYIPTGHGLTWDEDYTGPGSYTPELEDQTMKLTYYPDRSMNPYLCTDFTNRALFSLLYQSLFSVDHQYQPEPQLCKTYRISQDMRTYTFFLESAFFSDGTPLTAQDVVASFSAAKASTYYGGRFSRISDFVADSTSSITVTVNTPMENLPLLLDIPIVKESDVQLNAPIGSGPYYYDATTQPAILRRTSNWWCKVDLAVTSPAITLTAATSIAGIRDAFEFEGLSLVCADPGSDRYADYRCDYELWDCENGIFLYLACNMNSEVFMEPKIRSALSKAIDRDTLAASYYRGFARSAALPASPDSPFYSEPLAAKYAYDGGTALTEAVSDTRKVGKEIVLLINKDDSLRSRVGKDIQNMLSSCGLKVTISEVSSSSYNKALKNKDYDLYLGQTKLSPNMDLSAFFSNKGSLNYGGFSDVALNALCSDALANYGNYYSLHKSVMDDGRLCPILFRSYAVYATRGLLTGLSPSRDNVFYYSLGKTMENALLDD